MSEFDLINQFFKAAAINREDVALGIGDDCAILSPPPGMQLAVSTDTLISGVHFPQATSPEDIGYKSLAVNLSDLAAMGATPAWVSLAISLPQANEAWLKKFMQGFNQLANQYQLALIGGDTTQGPLSITINIVGFVEPGHLLKRSNAKPGDQIFVTGTLGDAALGLAAVLSHWPLDSDLKFCIERLNRPQPRVVAGQLLAHLLDDVSHNKSPVKTPKNQLAAIDISDGLLGDLNHICQASQVGANLYLDKMPLSPQLSDYYNQSPDWNKVINSGDDYELCFTCPESALGVMHNTLSSAGIIYSQVGEVTASKQIQCFDKNKQLIEFTHSGYKHFEEQK